MGRSSYYLQWEPYVSVAQRRSQARQEIARRERSGKPISPVEIEGRVIARTFWGKAWCDNLESYSDYSNRMPRGRTYVRNGSVIDLRIEAGRVQGLVSGSEIYELDIEIEPLATKRWNLIKKSCAGQIGPLIELLQGKISKKVMEIVTRKADGLFPSPQEISLSCSCPDRATMCKHVAAILYGVGWRLDREPELLFALRGVDPAEMAEAAAGQSPSAGKERGRTTIDAGELSSLFGVDIITDVLPTGDASKPAKSRAQRQTRLKQPEKKRAPRRSQRTTEASKAAPPAATSGKPSLSSASRKKPRKVPVRSLTETPRMELSQLQLHVLHEAGLPRTLAQLSRAFCQTDQNRFHDQIILPLRDSGLLRVVGSDGRPGSGQKLVITEAGEATLGG